MNKNTSMNHAIFKYQLTKKKTVVELPSGAIITGFAPGSKGFNLYALVCTDEGVKTEKRAFAIAKVGDPLPVSATTSKIPVAPITIGIGGEGVTVVTLFEIYKCDTEDWKAF